MSIWNNTLHHIYNFNETNICKDTFITLFGTLLLYVLKGHLLKLNSSNMVSKLSIFTNYRIHFVFMNFENIIQFYYTY